MPLPRTTGSAGGLDAKTGYLVAFPILDLPPELVIRIVQQAVVISSQDKPIPIDGHTKAHQEPAVTRVCRFLRCEGLPLFYKHNTFMVLTTTKATHELFKWIHRIGLQRASTIRSLQMCWCISGSASFLVWEDFLHEMNFLEDCARHKALGKTLGDKTFVRFQNGKLVLGSGSLGEYYELSFSQSVQAGARWRKIAEFSTLYTLDSSKRDFADEDFWVPLSSSDITTSEVEQHESGRTIE